ncbi:MAG: hypothetical protein KAS66_11665 [Candidatus Omnitrophica bacterium]|nr:hypothetical protein [Candidatus Omnitrophota bacterium]
METFISGLSLRNLIVQFKNSLYIPHHNSFMVAEIRKVNVMKLFYTFLLSAILITAAYYHFVRIRTNKHIPPLEFITTIGIMGFLLFAGIQQVHRLEHFKFEKNKYANKTVEEKFFILFGETYRFSKICQELLPGHHYGKLITDFDISKSPYMRYQRTLSYHLYPKVSLRFKKHFPKDCLILYHKKDPLEHIPKDYKILFASKDNNYILARSAPTVK